jgi:hypothetical protein
MVFFFQEKRTVFRGFPSIPHFNGSGKIDGFIPFREEGYKNPSDIDFGGQWRRPFHPISQDG